MSAEKQLSPPPQAAINSSLPSSSANSISKSVEPSMADNKEMNVPNAEKEASPVPESLEKEVDVLPDASPAEEEIEYPKSWRLGLITAALCLSVFCMALDNTIIA